MKKIFYLITSLDYGGAEKQVSVLANTFCKRGFEVYVISMIEPNSEFVSKNFHSDISIISLGMKRGRLSMLSFIKFIKILNKKKPNILHCHMVHANLLGRVSRIFFKTDILISTAHSTFEGGKFREFLYRITNSLSDINTNVSIVATNRYVEEKIFPKDKTRFIPNGIKNPKIFSKKEILNLRESF